MRLIDADFLKEWVDEYLSVFKKYDKGTIKGFVDHAPTIEPKRGEWILECDGEDECDDLYRCPFCGTEYGCAKYDKPNFCHNCGADMREREGE